MAIIYTWSVTNLLTWDTDVCKDAVHEAAWKVTADDGTNTSETTGITAFADPTKFFIAYEDLTEANIISWIQSTIGPLRLAEAENAAAAGLATSSYVDKQLPWKKVSVATSKKV